MRSAHALPAFVRRAARSSEVISGTTDWMLAVVVMTATIEALAAGTKTCETFRHRVSSGAMSTDPEERPVVTAPGAVGEPTSSCSWIGVVRGTRHPHPAPTEEEPARRLAVGMTVTVHFEEADDGQ